jgi:sialic acid synthase SpsE
MDPSPHLMIGDRRVSAVDPCYVIAEVGVNHNGDPDIALQLIDLAAKAGADAVKFQTFRTAALVSQKAEKAEYQRRQTGGGSQAEMLARLELDHSTFARLRDRCLECGVDFISTAFDAESLADVLSLGPKCLKWPSGELTNHPLLKQAARAGLPILLSTGMADLSEIASALALIEREGGGDVAILQCVSDYPAPIEQQNLRTLTAMGAAFNRVTGFSDHTVGPWAAIAARALGMAVLEKHITLDSNMEGPDHAASMEIEEFASLVQVLRKIERALGDGVKRPTSSEIPTRLAARKSLVYVSDLATGHVLAADDLTAKRPGGGLGPDRLDLLVGRRLVKAVKREQLAGFGDAV